MKKLLFLLVMLLLPLGVSAQEFLRIEDVEYDNVCSSQNGGFFSPHRHKWDRRMPKKLLLSDGHYLKRGGNHLYFDGGIYWMKDHCCEIKTNLPNFREVSKDKDFIYHVGKLYLVETITYKGTLTIKSATVHEVKTETSAALNGDFSYNGFLAFWKGIGGGIGKARGKISGSMRGGQKTVVNLIFDNGTYASIEASDEPIWLEAKTGMKVKLYKLRDAKLYELIL